MKKIVFMAVCAIAYCSCRSERDIQMRLTDVKVMAIDTVKRMNLPMKMITWRTPDNIRYVTFNDFDENYQVGETMKAFTKR